MYACIHSLRCSDWFIACVSVLFVPYDKNGMPALFQHVFEGRLLLCYHNHPFLPLFFVFSYPSVWCVFACCVFVVWHQHHFCDVTASCSCVSCGFPFPPLLYAYTAFADIWIHSHSHFPSTHLSQRAFLQVWYYHKHQDHSAQGMCFRHVLSAQGS